MLASPRLSPRTWSSSSFASQSSRLDLISMDLIQVDDVNDTRRLRSEKENVPPKTSRSQRHVPVKKQRSLRTSPKRVYHHANSTWIAPSPSLLQFSSQPFLHLERDQHLLSCFKHAHLRFPVIHTVRLPSISSITDSQPFWLILYFVFNLALTLYNKLVLVHFPFPYTLTALHALSCTVGGNIMLGTGAYRPAQLTTSQSILLAAFSVLYAVNIAVSNLSLNLVNVAFHQVVRAATPIFTIALSTFLFGKKCSQVKMITLVPVIAGVGLATYGDYYFTLWGFLLTFLGTILAALKTVLTHVLQSPSFPSAPSPQSHAPRLLPTLHPLDLLTRMSPLALAQCVLYAHLSGELDGVRAAYEAGGDSGWALVGGLIVNGAIAFGLNVVSFTANKKVGALSMTVAANVKQALTILFAVTMFNLTITGANALGISLTLAGGAWYALVEYQEKQKRRKNFTGS